MAKVVGTNGDDSGADALIGTDGKDKILGKGGDDEIYGLGGNDRLFGGAGDDSIFGGLGDDRIFGGSGDDIIEGNEGDDNIKGGSGDDTIDGGSGDDWLGGGSGNDFIEGGEGRDDISGGSGDDTIDGGADADWIFGGSGNDTIAGGDGADIIKGGSGNDIVDGGSGNDWIVGNSGNDILEGGAGNDVVIGDSGWCSGASGDDYVDGGAGYDAVFAQAGNDVATYNMSENLGFWDYYDGGRGNDVLRLELTSVELASTAVQADIAAYRSFLATHSNPDTDHGKRFDFSAFGLAVRDFETLEIVTLNTGPTANDDSNPTDAVVEAGINPDGTPNAGDPSATGNVLDNDTDPDVSDVLTVSGVEAGSTAGPVAGNIGGSGIAGTYGTLILAADGTWTYALDNADADTNALAQGETATDVFSYTISDLAGKTSTATLSIDISGTNDAAEITGVAQGTVIENAEPVSVPNDLDAADVDNTDDAFQAVANGASANGFGTYTVKAAGEWFYTLDNGNAAVNALGGSDTLSDSFTVFTEDGTAKTVDITILGANDAPEAGDQAFTIGQNETLDRIALDQSDVDAGDQLSDVLAVIDPKPKSPPKDGGDALVFFDENESGSTFQPSQGSGLLTNHDDGTFSFDTDGDYEFLGEGETFDVEFTHTVRDQAGETVTASVTITIEGENDAPVTVGSSWTIPEEFTFSTGDVTGFDPDDNDSVTFAVVSGPAHAAFFEFDAVLGTFVYTPEADFNGTDSFTFKANDGRLDSNISTATINVTPVNDAAVITGDVQGTVGEDAVPNTVSGDLDAADVDNDGDVFQAVAIGAATANGYGTYAVDAAGVWTYTLDNANAAVNALNAFDTLTDSFTVYTEDGTAQIVDITINGANDAPLAVDQMFTIGQNGSLDRIALDQSDVDAGDHLTDVLTVENPNAKSSKQRFVDYEENESGDTFQPQRFQGLLSNHDDGTFSFDTNGDYEFIGEGETFDVEFTYTVEDQAGETATATVTITIEGENDAPTTRDTTRTIQEDSPGLIGGVVREDPDDNDVLTVILVDGPAHAAFFEFDPVLASFTYAPEVDFNGTDSFTYKANDGRVDSNISTVTFNVTPVNDAAVITGTAQGTVVEDAVPNTVSGDLDATDVDNTDDVFQAVANGATTNGYGTYAVDAAGVWTYTLDNANAAVNALSALETLSDSFTVYTEDGTAQTVDITITGANDAPVAADQTFTIGQNGTLDRVALAQSDVDAGDQLTDVLTVENPQAKSSKQRFVDYEENESGDTFQPQRFQGLLSNHDDGTFSFDTNGDYEFIGEGETFDVEFTYIVEDQAGETATATVTIAIEGENDAPTTRDTTRTIQEDSPGLIGGVVREDPDDNDVLTVILVDGPAHAAFFEFDPVLASFTYAPEADFNGTDSFTYKANDGRVDSNISTVTFNVTPVNDAAVITGTAQGTVVEDAVPNTVSGDLDAADVDNTDDVFQAVANGATTNGYGTYAVDAAGVWTYTLDNGNAAVDALNALDMLTDSFTVLSEDGTAQTVDITINGADDGPVAADDVGSATEAGGVANGTPGSNATDNVLDNDTSVSGSLEVTGIRTGNAEGSGTAGTLGVALAGQYGTLTMQADGSYIYVVNDTDPEVQALNVTGANTSLTDTFNYTTSDGSLTDTAVLAITINGANDAPTAQPLTLYVKTGESVDGVLVGGDVDGDDDAGSLIYQLVSAPDTGELTGGLVNGDFDSAFTFITPRRGQSDAVFTYKTVDSHGASSEHTTVTVIVNAPTAPTAVDDAFVTDEDTQLVGNVLEDNGNGADSDINGDALSVTAGTFATAQGGSVTFQANGDFTYDPLADFNGEDTFTYEVVDVDGSSTGTVTVTVNPIDDLLL